MRRGNRPTIPSTYMQAGGELDQKTARNCQNLNHHWYSAFMLSSVREAYA